MKFGLYTHPSTDLTIRCIDGHFDMIRFMSQGSPRATWEAIISAPSIACSQSAVKSKISSEYGGHLTYSRSVAKTLYGVPDDVDLYIPGELDGTGVETKSERLQIRIEPNLKQKLQKLAAADGRTVSNYIEKLIRDAFDKNK